MLVCYALRGPAVAPDPLDPRCEAEEWKAPWLFELVIALALFNMSVGSAA
jgi:hypothetical protein